MTDPTTKLTADNPPPPKGTTMTEKATTAKAKAAEPEAAPVEHPGFAAALAAFQRTLPTIRKGNTANVATKGGGSYNYSYADLTDVSEVALPLLAVQGIAWYSGLDTNDQGDLVLRWELMHTSGEGRNGTLPIGRSGTPWQELGSAITYARRYALCAAAGIAPGGDDDDAGATAGSNQSESRSQRQESPQAPVEQKPERLPEGLYDLAALTSYEATVELFKTARAAGHLALLVGVQQPDGTIVGEPLGKYLTDLGTSLKPAPGEESDEAPDAPAEATPERDLAEPDYSDEPPAEG